MRDDLLQRLAELGYQHPESPAGRFVRHMLRHIDTGGDPNPVQTYVTTDGYRLGSQLARARRGERVVLSDEQWAELVARGVNRRSVRVPADQAAEQFMDEMRTWIADGGDPNVEQNVVVDGYRLGGRLARYRFSGGPLSEQQWSELEELGVSRAPTGAERFVSEMRRHIAAGGDPNPAQTYVTPHGYSLGLLLGQLRRGAWNGSTSSPWTEAHWAQLDALGVSRDVVVESGADKLARRLQEWIDAGGDPNPDSRVACDDGYAIGQQLGRARRGQLPGWSEHHWAMIEPLGTRRDRDLEGADRLLFEMRAHLAAGGDPSPPENYRTTGGYALGTQLNKARRGHLAGLSEAEWAELDAMGVPRISTRRWSSQADRLVHEMQRHVVNGGDPNPVQGVRAPGGYHLGSALGQARSGVIRDMTEEHWAQLEEVGVRRRSMGRGRRGAAEQLLQNMHAYVAAGGDPNPPQSLDIPGFGHLGVRLSKARSGHISMTDGQWAELEALGVKRGKRRKNRARDERSGDTTQ